MPSPGRKVGSFFAQPSSIFPPLTHFALEANQLSPEIFWPTQKDDTDPYWPNLQTLVIRTSIETAQGEWVLQEQDARFGWHNFDDEVHSDYDPDDLEDADEGLKEDVESGSYPEQTFRVRPDHNYLNSLALNIARAASKMSKIKEILFDMGATSVKPDPDRYGRIRGHAFSFHAGSDGHPPRVDWVFPCFHGQLIGWSPPAEASVLWRQKCGDGLVESILAIDEDRDEDDDYSNYAIEQLQWRCWQDGQVKGKSNDLEDYFQGYEFEVDPLRWDRYTRSCAL